MTNSDRLLEQLAGIAAIVLLIGGCIYILRPFLGPLVWAAIIAYSTWEIYRHQVKLLRGRRALSAALMVIAVLLIVMGPFAYAVAALIDQAQEVQSFATRLIEKGLPPVPQWIAKLPFVGVKIEEFWARFLQGDPQIADFIRDKLAAPLGQWLLTLSASTAMGVLQMALSIFLAYFFYVGGETVLAWLQAIIRRIAGDRGPYLLRLTGDTIHGVVYGTLGNALIQGVLAGFGYWIAGVPGAGIWGFMTFFLAVLPILGAPIIWIPATLWLYSQGEIGWAIFLLSWGIIVIGAAENLLKPLMISKGKQLPFLSALLGMMGGVLAFGFLGMFIGPTLLAVGHAVMVAWATEADFVEEQPAQPPASPQS